VSLSALQAFVSSVSADGQLRQRLHAAAGLDDVVDLASSHGHDFSKATLLKAHAASVSSAPDHQLEAINSWGDALMQTFGASDKD
jgi:predicted ribosomally synthesized peptide with nif11-like leader